MVLQTISNPICKYQQLWTQQELDFLKVSYKGTKGNVFSVQQSIKRMFGIDRTYYAIRHKAKDLELTKHRSRKWSKLQESELENLASEMPVKKIALKMNRTLHSIRNKCNELGIKTGTPGRCNWYTQQDLVHIFGVCNTTILRWIKNKELIADKQGSSYKISIKDLRNFIIKYPFEFTGRNVDMIQIVDILTSNVK